MKVEIIQEAGYEAALLGLGLSFGKTSEIDVFDFIIEETIINEMDERAKKLAHKQEGHNKFTETMMVWIDVKAPLYWWKQADTYRMSTKQSESTMHTVMKNILTLANFSEVKYPEYFERHIKYINTLIEDKEFDEVIKNLPDSFLQRLIWCMSYKTLQNIISQRKNHKLKEWKTFCDEVLRQAQHPEFLKREE